MSFKKIIADSALKYASRAFDAIREPREVRNDLAPILKRLDQIEDQMTPRWVGFAVLTISFLILIIAVWILIKVYIG